MSHSHSSVDWDPSGQVTIGHYFIAYLDLLGQSEKLRQLGSLPAGLALDPTFVARLQDSIGHVFRMRKGLHGAFLGMASSKLSDKIPPGATPEQIAIARELDGQELRLMGASDSIVAFIPLGTPTGRLALRGLLQSISAMSLVIVEALGAGIVIRGALGVGVGCEITPGEIYGPCLLECYEAEQHRAVWPRVVACDSLPLFLSQVQSDESAGILPDINRTIATATATWLYRDSEGRLALDYLGQPMMEMATAFPSGFIAALIDRAHVRVLLLVEKFRDDPKLGSRYIALADYFSSRNGGFDEHRRNTALARYELATKMLPGT